MPINKDDGHYKEFDLLSYDEGKQGSDKTVITRLGSSDFSDAEKFVFELERQARSHEELQARAHDLFKKKAALERDKRMNEDMEFLKTVDLKKTRIAPLSFGLPQINFNDHQKDALDYMIKIYGDEVKPTPPVQTFVATGTTTPKQPWVPATTTSNGISLADAKGIGQSMSEHFLKELEDLYPAPFTEEQATEIGALAAKNVMEAMQHLPRKVSEAPPTSALDGIQLGALVRALQDSGYNANPSEIAGVLLKARKADPEAPARPVVRPTTSRPSQTTVDPSAPPRRIVEV